MDFYGLRTREAAGVATLDTSVTPVRSLKMMTVTGNGEYNQYFSIPEITAESFVVVDALYVAPSPADTWSPQAFWSPGQLHLRGAGTMTWQVMILSRGGEPFAAPGSYGIRARNNNIATQIDAVNRVLTVKHAGGFQFGQMRPGSFLQWADINFPAPITTYERPMIFLNATDYLMAGNFVVKGGPGNWTGFMLKAWPQAGAHGPVANSPMTVQWYCATYEVDASAIGLYDVTVRDAAGNRIFSSTANISSLNNQPASNSFIVAGPPIVGRTYYSASAQMPWTGSYGDYFLANALLSCTNIFQTTNPIKANFGGFLPGNRGVLQMYTDNYSGAPTNPIGANGRTLFAARPMRPL